MHSRSIVTLCVAVAGVLALPCIGADKPRYLAPDEKVLVLPTEFRYAQAGIVREDPMVDRTARAQASIDTALQRAVKREATIAFVSMPSLSKEEAALVAHHTAVLSIAALSATLDLETKRMPWRDWKRGRMDYSVGPGLAFLAERSGADVAIFVSGSRLFASIGKYFLNSGTLHQMPATFRGNVKTLSAVVVDLKSGDLLAIYYPVRGYDGEPDELAGANTWVRALFDTIPGNPRNDPPYDPPRRVPSVPYVSKRMNFRIVPPQGWETYTGAGSSAFSHHFAGLESILVDHSPLDRAWREQGLNVRVETDPLTLGRAEVERLTATRGFEHFETVSLMPVPVAGRPGFRLEARSRSDFSGAAIERRHVIYGLTSESGVHLLRYDAPAIHVFEKHLPDFEAAVATFETR